MFRSDDPKKRYNELELVNALYSYTEKYKQLSADNRRLAGMQMTDKQQLKHVIKRAALKRLKKLKPAKGAVSQRNIDRILPGAVYIRPEPEFYFSAHRIAVYTTVFGAYDTIPEPLLQPDNIDYYVITDQELPADTKWIKLDPAEVIPSAITDAVERSRYIKMLPHLLFPEYEYSVYVDGNIWITGDLTVLTGTLETFPLAMHRHKNRDCVYEEIEACLLKKKDTQERLEEHRSYLLKNGVPNHYGLLEATVIARKHGDPLCRELMEAWWDEFLSHSHRDQISLIDCLWTHGIPVDRAAVLGDNIRDNHHFVITAHN